MSNPHIYTARAHIQHPNYYQLYYNPRFYRDMTHFPSSRIVEISPYNGQAGTANSNSSNDSHHVSPMWDIGMKPLTQPPLYPIVPFYNGGNYLWKHTHSPTHQAARYRYPSAHLPLLLSPPCFLYVNPLINAEAPRSDFIFDLAPTAFLPLRQFDNGQSSLLTPIQLSEIATLPALMRLRIVCDMIPEWPIDIDASIDARNNRKKNPRGPLLPILLINVLIEIHKHMQRQILREDWEKLNLIARQEVSKQYTRRCTAAGSTTEQERAKGVKRIDFLEGKTRMVGLLLDGEVNGWCIMKLIVTGG